MHLQIQLDGNGNPFIMVANVRVSLVEKTDPRKDWANTGRYLSFRALAAGSDTQVKIGAELPFTPENVDAMLKVIKVLRRYAEAKKTGKTR